MRFPFPNFWMRVLVSLIACYLMSVEVTLGSNPIKTNYCVLPDGLSTNDSLNYQQCQPLMWYVNQTQILSGSVLIFLEGTHTLYDYTSMIFVNVSDFMMIGNGTISTHSTELVPSPSTRVVCKDDGGFLFLNSVNISIKGLSFVNCGGKNKRMSYGDYIVIAAVAFCTCYNVTLKQVLITESIGYGLAVKNTHGKFYVSGSAFMKSKLSTSKLTGNAIIFFEDYCQSCMVDYVSVTIVNSSFLHGNGTLSSDSNGTGLSMYINHPLVDVNLNNNTFRSNVGGNNGGNIAIRMLDATNSTVNITNSYIIHGSSYNGGGVYLEFGCSRSNHNLVSEHHFSQKGSKGKRIVSFTNTMFTNNNASRSGGGVLVTHHEQNGITANNISIYIHNCTFVTNSAKTGAAIQITKHGVPPYELHSVPQMVVTFDKCIIAGNLLHRAHQSNEDGILDILSVKKTIIKNSTFSKNNGTALFMVNSVVIFEEYTLFQGNSALYGGAIKFCDSSLMFLKEYSYIKFESNCATVAGGAIYSSDQCLKVSPPCFFQPMIDVLSVKQLKNKTTLEFANNKAKIAGSAVYGGSVDNCFTYKKYGESGSNFYKSTAVYDTIFKFSDLKSDVSRVTSDPYGICVCDPLTNKTNCSSRQLELHQKEIFPGEWFDISVSAVGQMNGSVPALINVISMDKTVVNISRNDLNLHKPTLTDSCQTLHLAVFSNKTNTQVKLILEVMQPNPVSERPIYFKLPKLRVIVPLKQCPSLFELNETNGCDCHHELKYNKVSCDINSNTVTIQPKPEHVWIGCITNNTTNYSNFTEDQLCDRIELSKQCFHHCSTKSTLNVSDLNAQCEEGRTGRVCGSCEHGQSLSLGRPQCLDDEVYCSWWKTLIYLIVFVLSGPLILLFLTLFNFTISEGTVNGLLFYANIVHANNFRFFPSSASSNADLFRVFISWLNLDFGFVVCFYAGFDEYQKIWWEFGFLFYLFLLGVLIIYLSNKFVYVTRFIGRNVVSVLATIALISFPKLVRTSIKVLEPSTVDILLGADKYSILVWHNNGDIDYFQGKHIPLVILAIILCTVALLYTLSLLFIQCLQKWSHLCILKWVSKLQPFYDANTGPCRDHYRFWPGFLLFARFGLYCLYISDSVNLDQRLYMVLGFCVFMFFLACVSPHGVYKKWPLNILEFSFFLNLGFLSAFVVSPYKHKAIILTFVSVGIAAITFSCILVYHGYRRVSGTRKWKRLVIKIKRKHQSYAVLRNQVRDRALPDSRSNTCTDIETEEPDEHTPLSRQAMPPVVRFDHLRESLLADNEQV